MDIVGGRLVDVTLRVASVGWTLNDSFMVNPLLLISIILLYVLSIHLYLSFH